MTEPTPALDLLDLEPQGKERFLEDVFISPSQMTAQFCPRRRQAGTPVMSADFVMTATFYPASYLTPKARRCLPLFPLYLEFRDFKAPSLLQLRRLQGQTDWRVQSASRLDILCCSCFCAG